jgi:four helix bundle protein
MNKSQLEERLINFAVLLIEIVNELPNTKAGNHLGGQLVRSGTSPALNYGEAQSGESRKDFIHKIKVVLKELRESFVCLKIIHRAKLHKSEKKMQTALTENDELISIFVKSVETAQNNMGRGVLRSKIVNR